MAAEVAVAGPSREFKKTKKKQKSDEEIPLEMMGSKNGEAPQIGDVLQHAYLQSTLNEGEKKKKKKNKDLLESIKKADGIRKDDDGATLLANTFDPNGDTKSNKNNLQRQQLNEMDNPAFIEYENELSTTQKKPKRKTKKSASTERTTVDSDAGETIKPIKISDLAPPTSSQPVNQPLPPPTQSQPIQKEKKTKKKSGKADSSAEGIEMTQMNNSGSAAAAVSSYSAAGGRDLQSADQENIEGETELQAKPRKKKKTKKKNENTEDLAAAYGAALNTPGDDGVVEGVGRAVPDKGQVLQVIVHRTDKLKPDFYVAHPVVRIHVVDLTTGQYLKKQHRDRSVSSRFETENDKVDYVLAIMTQPYDFKKNFSTLPMWEEPIVFNENFRYFVQTDPAVILLFELMDFVSMNAANKQYSTAKQEGGWHQIAWAFLKLVDPAGQPNTDKKTRLQLYEPNRKQTNAKPAPGHPLELYQWYKSSHRIKYPSTLYVTAKSIVLQSRVEPSSRSMFANQEERGRTAYDDLSYAGLLGAGGRLSSTTAQYAKEQLPWSRLQGQQCRIPNTVMHNLPAAKKGCFVVRFSNDGKYLACGCHGRDGYPILIYEIPSGVLRSELFGHYSIIYDLSWSFNNHFLLSASSDGTAKVWRTDDKASLNSLIKMLPHPSFVYTSKFHPIIDKLAVTGGYDRLLRVWNLKTDDQHAELVQELEGHTGYVNAMCFNQDGSFLYSADSAGRIRAWSTKDAVRDWRLHKEFIHPDLEGNSISQITVHPNDRRLLVHTKNNKLQMFDLRISSVMQKYSGALNFRENVRSTVTPCGTFVFAGSEDGLVYVWNTESGDQVAMYTDLGYRNPVCDVDFHPFDHIVAFCSYGDSQPIKIYHYEHQSLAASNKVEAFVRPMPPERTDIGNTALYGGDSLMADVSQNARIQRVMQTLETVDHANSRRSAMSTYAQNLMMSTDGSKGMLTTTSIADYTPTFATISGRKDTVNMGGSMRNLSGIDRHPQYSFNNTGSNRVKVTFPTASAGSSYEVVTALYDYQSQRSDELSFMRGDQIRVIYKENRNWWTGELVVNGQKGFFPANYVASSSPDYSVGAVLASESSAQFSEEPSRNKSRESTMHAVKTKSGELKFVSGTEDSEDDDRLSTTGRRKKTRKSRASANGYMMEVRADIENPPPLSDTRSDRRRNSRASSRDSTFTDQSKPPRPRSRASSRDSNIDRPPSTTPRDATNRRVV